MNPASLPVPSLRANGSIALAVIVSGLMAGFFWTYTFNVNPALAALDGSTYATVQSLLNRNVRHAAFFVLFFGGAAVPLIALALNYQPRRDAAFWLVAASAAVYVLGVVVFTRQVNLPLNAYTESWAPMNLPADWTATRDRWNEANALRVGTSMLAFALNVAALVVRAMRGAVRI